MAVAVAVGVSRGAKVQVDRGIDEGRCQGPH